MSNFFLYPKADKMLGSPNPYISNFINALSKDHTVVNGRAKNKGVFNLFKYLFQADIYIFNWIENLPEKRFGKIQVILFVIFMGCAKVLRKKILWILHNKYSHHREEDRWIDFMYYFMMKNADKIITHSNSGLDFVKSDYPKFSHKVDVIIHPVSEMLSVEYPTEISYDFLIWGSIFPYKGIDKFLSFIRNNPQSTPYKILLVGKCFNSGYKDILNGMLSENVTFHDELYEMDKIVEFARKSKFTLFTYKSNSVISSGSLIDSIRMGSIIIGPNHGGFKDLSHYSFLKTYDSYEDIFQVHREYKRDLEKEKKDSIRFYRENNWSVFIQKLEKICKEF